MSQKTTFPNPPKPINTNTTHVQNSSSAPPDLRQPTPGAAADSSEGIPSGRGRATALTDEVIPPKPRKAGPSK